jgi:hypothetical protein
VDLNCHPIGSYDIAGSMKLLDVKVKNRASNVLVRMTGEPTQLLDDLGTHLMASEHFGDATVEAMYNAWVMYVDGSNVVVNTDSDLAYWGGISGDDLTINTPITISDGDLTFDDEPQQHVTLYFTRRDL